MEVEFIFSFQIVKDNKKKCVSLLETSSHLVLVLIFHFSINFFGILGFFFMVRLWHKKDRKWEKKQVKRNKQQVNA